MFFVILSVPNDLLFMLDRLSRLHLLCVGLSWPMAFLNAC